MEKFSVQLENCNNIKLANLHFIRNQLNIRYASNGTGKSTISSAICTKIEGGDLNYLTPFGSKLIPKATVDKSLKKVMVFNEEFLARTVFQESTLIEDAFDVFIKTEEYDKRLAEIEDKFSEIEKMKEEVEYRNFYDGLRSIYEKLSLTGEGKLAKRGSVKSVARPFNQHKYPRKLEKFKPFFSKDKIVVDWVDWKLKGESYDDDSICPFCSLDHLDNHEEIREIFKEHYKKGDIKNLKELLDTLNLFKDYIGEDKFNVLSKLLFEGDDEEEKLNLLTRLREEAGKVNKSLLNLEEIKKGRVNKDELSDLENQLKSAKIDEEEMEFLNSEKSKEFFGKLNSSIVDLQGTVNRIKQDLGRFNSLISKESEKVSESINHFLETADINYRVEIKGEHEDDFTVRLLYNKENEVGNIKRHLSWGEKNAFSLALFMHYALSASPDLIILDDPISSFDENKKYAINNYLFKTLSKGMKNFRGESVVLFTHDLEPVIDFVKVGKPTKDRVSAQFYRNNEGELEVKEITKDDLLSLVQQNIKIAKCEDLNIINRLVGLRKVTEIVEQIEETKCAYSILSALIHATDIDYLTSNGIDGEEFTKGKTFIKQYIEDFDYDNILKELLNQETMFSWYDNCKNSYFRIQIFRCLVQYFSPKNKGDYNDVFIKYINEFYHIENDLLYYLDVKKFDTVSATFMAECDHYIEELKAELK